MREKLLNLMKSEGLTSSRLAEILEIQPSGISHILSGRNKPGFDLLQKILRRFPRINPDWLLLDSDTMYREEVPTPSIQTQATSSGNLFNTSLPDLHAAPNNNPITASAVGESLMNEKSQQIPVLPENSDVVRVVVFYADRTCENFITKK